jgi:hypothetical protein
LKQLRDTLTNDFDWSSPAEDSHIERTFLLIRCYLELYDPDTAAEAISK